MTAGAAANSDINVADIRVRDCVVNTMFASDGTEYDVSKITITEAGKIQTTETTSAKTLHILWADLSCG